MFTKSMFKIGFVSAGNIFNALIGFFLIAVLAKTLNLEQFGIYAFLTSFLVVFSKLIDFGSNNIFVSKSLTENKHLTNSFHTSKLLLLSITIPTGSAALYFFDFRAPEIYLFLVLGLVGYTVNYTLNAHFQKAENYVALLALNTLPAFIKGTYALLLLTNGISVNYIQAFAIFSLALFSDILLIPMLSLPDKTLRLSFTDIRTLLISGFPSGVSQFLQEAWPAINNALAKIVLGFADVGIFSFASKISSVFNLLSLSVFTVLLPQNAKRKAAKQRYNIKEVFVLACCITVLCIFGIIGASVFLTYFFDNKFTSAIGIVDTLIISAALSSIHTFMENYFIVENKTGEILTISTIKVAVFILCIVAFLGNLSLGNLALANLIASFTALTATLLYIRKHHLATT